MQKSEIVLYKNLHNDFSYEKPIRSVVRQPGFLCHERNETLPPEKLLYLIYLYLQGKVVFVIISSVDFLRFNLHEGVLQPKRVMTYNVMSPGSLKTQFDSTSYLQGKAMFWKGTWISFYLIEDKTLYPFNSLKDDCVWRKTDYKLSAVTFLEPFEMEYFLGWQCYLLLEGVQEGRFQQCYLW